MAHYLNIRRYAAYAAVLATLASGTAVQAQTVQIGPDSLAINPDGLSLGYRALFQFGGTLEQDGRYAETLPDGAHCPQINSDGRARPAFDPVKKYAYGVLVNHSNCKVPKFALDADGNRILADLPTRVAQWVRTLQPAVLTELKGMLGVTTNEQVIDAVVANYDAMFKDIIDSNFGGLPMVYEYEKDDQGNTVFEDPGAFMYRVAVPDSADAPAVPTVIRVPEYGYLEAFGDVTLGSDGTAYSFTTPSQGDNMPKADGRLVKWARDGAAPQAGDYGFLFARESLKAGTAGVLSGGAWAGGDADGANVFLYTHRHDVYRVDTATGREEHLAYLKDLSVPTKAGGATVALGDPSAYSAVRGADGSVYAIYRLTEAERIAGEYLSLGRDSDRKDGFLFVLLRLAPEYLSRQPKDDASPREPATPLAFLTFDDYDQSTQNQRAQIVEIGDYLYGRTSNRLWRVAKNQNHQQNHQVEFIKEYEPGTGVRLGALAAGKDGWLYGRLTQGSDNYLFRVNMALETAASIGGSLQLLQALDGHAVDVWAASQVFERDGRLIQTFVGESGTGGANNHGALHTFDIDMGAAPEPEPEPEPGPEPEPEPEPNPEPEPTPTPDDMDSGGGGGAPSAALLALLLAGLAARRGVAAAGRKMIKRVDSD